MAERNATILQRFAFAIQVLGGVVAATVVVAAMAALVMGVSSGKPDTISFSLALAATSIPAYLIPRGIRWILTRE